MAIHTEHPWVNEISTSSDLHIATLACGWSLGFLFLTATTAWEQTKQSKWSYYAILLWSEQLSCFIFALLAWLYMIGTLTHSLSLFVALLLLWSIQVQALLQIICNRVNLLWSDRRRQRMLKYGVAFFIFLINVSVFCVWVPARLQVSDRYIAINRIWDRVEKCIYLCVDAALNYLFIRVVKERLVDRGLDRYLPLVRHNQRLILVSIACDALIIGMMSLPNSFVYTSFHPVAYLIKLYIEMSLSSLIVDISSAKPQRDAPEKGFQGLQIAVSTHVETVATRFEDEEADLDTTGRRTRTPARPDLQVRLDRMRKERKERAEQHAGGSGRDSVASFTSEEKIEMDDWQARVQHLHTENGDENQVRFVN